ncbi:MAG: hypothetical protein ABIS69_00560 [Sediminibacterium sp.]
MITLNLSEFKDFNFKEVYKFIMLQTQNEFEIIVPKTYNPIDDDSFIIFWEYHIMAYTGQKLFEISSEFSYYVPAAESKQPFKFIVKINDLEKLADLLYELIHVLKEDDLTDTTTEFQLAASTFFNDAYDDKEEAVTWGLLTLANSFLSE